MARQKTGTPLLTAVPEPKPAQAAPLAALRVEICKSFPEREEIVRSLLVATVAGEHAVMLGPPGTAKSALARSFASAFASSYFEILMTRFTVPEEVFGPIKLSALQADRFERATAGYFPGAEIAFLDEIFKSNSAILNALLTGLNERVFHNDGKPVAIPLVSCIAASNELPEGPELDALYDRFLVRLVTQYVQDEDTFADLMTAEARGTRAKTITTRVDIRAEQVAAQAVFVTDETLAGLKALRAACRTAGLVVSDRRWIQCLSLVRAAAHVDGRTQTTIDDLDILESVLWRKPDERIAVAKLVQTCVAPDGATAVAELDAAKEAFARVANADASDKRAFIPLASEVIQILQDIEKRLAPLASGRKVDAAKAEVVKMRADVGKLASRAAGFSL